MAKLRAFIIVFGLLICLRFLVGCGSGGGGSTDSRTGGIEGYAFVQGGAIILRNSPTAPGGATALAGAAVTADGLGGTAGTDSSGRFQLRNVPVGQRKIHITPAAGSGVPALDIPVTVIGRATIQVGAFTVSRQQAVDSAKSALGGDPAAYRILSPQQPLPSGVTLEPALGNDSGQPDPALTYTPTSSQWLVYADAFAGDRFQHPVSYVLVDAESGAVTVRNATSWPQINGVNHYPDDDNNATANDLVQVGSRKAQVARTASITPILNVLRTGRDHVPGATNPTTYALLIQGNSRSDMETDLVNMKANLFGPNGLSGPSVITEWSPPTEGVVDGPAQIQALFDGICAQAREQDTILVYVTSHAFRSGTISIQNGVESDESTTPDGFLFPEFSLKAANCRACHVIYMIDTCHAGEAMVKWSTQTPHAGQKMTILASSLSTETSGGVTRRINAETGKTLGGHFTNAFLASLQAFRQANGSAAQANLTAIYNGAVARMPSTRQNPQTFFKWDGQSCGAAPATLISVSPTSCTATHTVGVTPCPQNLGSFALKNETDFSLSYNTTLSHSAFNLSNGSGSLGPGQTKSLGLSFNCGQVPPISTSLTIRATYGGSTHEIGVPIQLNSGN